MPKFQVVACKPMQSKPTAPTAWRATMVKGLFTDDAGEIEMVEVMMFPERGYEPPMFTAGENLVPVFQVRKNKTNGRPEFVIGSLNKPANVSKVA
jgi:hypothetical protein